VRPISDKPDSLRGEMPTRFKLRALLARAGMSQSELARRSGVSFATINRLCRNATETVALDSLDRIAGALRVEPGDLLQRDKQATRRPR